MSEKPSRNIPPLMVLLWLIITTAGILGSLYVVPWLMPDVASNTMHLSVLTMVIFSVAAAPAKVTVAPGSKPQPSSAIRPTSDSSTGRKKVPRCPPASMPCTQMQ